MLTYEMVLEIFADYLKQDKELEVLVSRHGYILIEWDNDHDSFCSAQLCHTPEELFDLLLDDCQIYEEIQLTKGRRELTMEDAQTAKEKCRLYMKKRKEAEKT